jgi:hypothetical protein
MKHLKRIILFVFKIFYFDLIPVYYKCYILYKVLNEYQA